MKFLIALFFFTVEAWAATYPLPMLGKDPPPIVGQMYSFTTAYTSGHPLDCGGGTCVFPFRGMLPGSQTGAKVNTKTGGLRCSGCAVGIYQVDDFHYVFVYN